MKNVFRLTLFLLLSVGGVQAGSLSDIRKALEQSSVSQVQEKVYVHTDNTCYFVGDTLWYKAYVVRADNLCPTDMSRILYVELLSPDGLLVERQQIVVNPEGYTCGQFVLTDSLYSGYYEMRAYTRWMLNFNMYHHRYSTQDSWWFYNKEMAADYYRVWDGLYSRVLPVYSKPEKTGDYDVRTMYQRPKTRLPRQKKDDLVVKFYPEGGHLIDGVENRVAFEVCDQHGEAVDVKGTVSDGQQRVDISTEYMGRGSFLITPKENRLKASFQWHDKTWSESLPKSEQQGVALRLDNGRLTISSTGLPQDKQYGVSILCRGSLKHFVEVDLSKSSTIDLPLDRLPVGVADVTLFDSDGRILADRLFFCKGNGKNGQNGLWREAPIVPIEPIKPTTTYQPYEQISIGLQLPPKTTFSLSVRDTGADATTYDDGNLMTDLLLSSELQGFIAYPSHYFERDDEEHRRHLDLLMMVQGWRKYKWEELADAGRTMRYQPEKSMTIEGSVYKTLSVNELEIFEPQSMPFNIGFKRYRDTINHEQLFGSELVCARIVGCPEVSVPSDYVYDWLKNTDDNLGLNNGRLKNDVLVEAEMAIGDDFVASTQKTKDGRFVFQVPPFYGGAYLKMKAYKENDSIKKNMLSRQDAKVLNESAFPDFYVKRDLFYPRFAKEYNFYEKHQPDIELEDLIDTISYLSMENDVHQLGNVNVRGHRRGRRAIDWNKPAFMTDAYDLYNDVTDYGLSFGMLNMRLFPVQVSRYLFGNMNRHVAYNVDGRLDNFTFYRNYFPFPPPPASANVTEVELESLYAQMQQYTLKRAPQAILDDLKLKRMSDIRIYTDYEHRNEDSTMVAESTVADVTVELVPFANDAIQPTFRDRHIYFPGFNYSVSFYQPDYSRRQPGEAPADYRRTLYWNPNARSDEQGRFTATFYNNGKETRIKMSAAGVTPDGRLLYSR